MIRKESCLAAAVVGLTSLLVKVFAREVEVEKVRQKY